MKVWKYGSMEVWKSKYPGFKLSALRFKLFNQVAQYPNTFINGVIVCDSEADPYKICETGIGAEYLSGCDTDRVFQSSLIEFESINTFIQLYP